MTTSGARIAGSDAARDWQSLRDQADIQYAPLPPAVSPPAKPPDPPEWLKRLNEWLESLFRPLGEAIGMSWPVLEKMLLALLALLVLFVLWRLLAPVFTAMRLPRAEAELEWAPPEAAAVALLADADRLAAEGRYGEATHLLLQRSVHHIAEARPDWLLPASTAREIALFPMLPEAAGRAFGLIAGRVEQSLFALRELDLADWQAARAAYAEFALQRLPGRAAA